MQRSIHPDPNTIGSAGDAIANHKYRFNWNTPIVTDPFDSSTVYFGGNVVFRTASDGQSWEVISPDLTKNDKSKQQSSGGPVVVDNTAAEFYNTILTIAPSRVRKGVIWAGADDGNVQVTRDGGKTWTNVTPNIAAAGLGSDAWVSTIDASPSDAGTAYVAADHHQDDDYAAYAYMTTDYGQTWHRISGDLPRGWVHVVREDPKNRNLLYAGTEVGLFASWDRGGHWFPIRGELPPVPVRDLFVHPRDNDLVIGTHGRGAYILDDVTPLQQLSAAASANTATLFDVRPAVRYEIWQNDASIGLKDWVGDNPMYGAIVSYWLPDSVRSARVEVRDADGKVVRTMRDVPKRAGMNRVAWDLRYEGAWQPRPDSVRAARADSLRAVDRGQQEKYIPVRPGTAARIDTLAKGDTHILADEESRTRGPAEREDEESRFNRPSAPMAAPGQYTIALVLPNATLTKPVRVDLDPRMQVPDADLRAQLAAGVQARDLESRVNRVLYRTNDLIRQLTALQQQLRQSATLDTLGGDARAATDARLTDVTDALRKLTTLRDSALARPIPGLGYRQYPRLREEVQSIGRMIAGPTSKPTDAQLRRYQELVTETQTVDARLGAILSNEIAKINEAMRRSPRIFANLTPIT